MNIWTRNNEIMRLTPRENQDVNKYWMCDYGRLNTYKFVNDESSRVNSPMMRPIEAGILSDDDRLQNCEWDDAIARTISELKNYNSPEIAFIASPFSTLEDNFVLKRFAEETIGTKSICYIPMTDERCEDDLLIRADRTPNTKGLKELGIKPIDQNFIDAIVNRKIKLVYLMNDTLNRLATGEVMMKSIEVGIIHLSNFFTSSKRATVIFPATTYAEMNGTFVNFQNRVQRIRQAVTTLELERMPGDFSVSRLDKFGTHNDRWTKGSKFNSRMSWKIITQISRAMGNDFGYSNTEEVFDDIASKITSFAGMDYDSIGNQGLLIGKAETTTV